MSKYVDVYILPIAEDKIDEYKKIAKAAGKIFRKHGALTYREYVISDANAWDMKTYPQIMRAKPGETIVYAEVSFKSEAHRNKSMKAIIADPKMETIVPPGGCPFNYKRMAYGGFKILVDA
jgi:uncharacterized protein YbaA (DUF1428 family)